MELERWERRDGRKGFGGRRLSCEGEGREGGGVSFGFETRFQDVVKQEWRFVSSILAERRFQE